MSGGVMRGKAEADTSQLNWLRLAQMGFAALCTAPIQHKYTYKYTNNIQIQNSIGICSTIHCCTENNNFIIQIQLGFVPLCTAPNTIIEYKYCNTIHGKSDKVFRGLGFLVLEILYYSIFSQKSWSLGEKVPWIEEEEKYKYITHTIEKIGGSVWMFGQNGAGGNHRQ